MHDSLWELVLIDEKGREQAHALQLDSEDRAKDMAYRWNLDRGNYRVKGHWVVSRLEGRLA